VLLLTQATKYDNASRIAPYEYIVIVYALFIDNYMFGIRVEIINIISLSEFF
jgi:hypothetical protein